jgi:hypothetical protein
MDLAERATRAARHDALATATIGTQVRWLEAGLRWQASAGPVPDGEGAVPDAEALATGAMLDPRITRSQRAEAEFVLGDAELRRRSEERAGEAPADLCAGVARIGDDWVNRALREHALRGHADEPA